MKCCKLTKDDFTTHNGCQWGESVTHEASGEGGLCSDGWLHAYEHPLLAALISPIHVSNDYNVLWEAEAEGEIKKDGQLKFGCTKLKTIKKIPMPEVTSEQRIRFAIYCVKEALPMDSTYLAEWIEWANRWLDGSNRSEAAARAAAEAARAAEAAERAAEAAERAAEAAARTAAWAADGEWAAAWAAVEAANDLDLIALAKQAIKDEENKG